MPKEAEYRVVYTTEYSQLQTELDELGPQGFRPILMSSNAAGGTTVILEHVIPNHASRAGFDSI
jgi:hypothetical protein